ncbi:MAG TPA: hypothetical protein VM709_16470, partial [Candidatus Sulfotelmatobacter sp.]|nr:hypothetical protein [Candidatus Sulfotelmatobacter sp.]
RASRTITDRPARARTIAAAKPFGPEPTTTASYLFLRIKVLIYLMPTGHTSRDPPAPGERSAKRKGGALAKSDDVPPDAQTSASPSRGDRE